MRIIFTLVGIVIFGVILAIAGIVIVIFGVALVVGLVMWFRSGSTSH